MQFRSSNSRFSYACSQTALPQTELFSCADLLQAVSQLRLYGTSPLLSSPVHGTNSRAADRLAKGKKQRNADLSKHALRCMVTYLIARSTANTKHLCVTLSYLTQFSRKYREKQQKKTIWYPQIIKNLTKTWQRRQIHDKKSSKIPQKQGKNDNLMSKIDQQRVLCFRNLSASKDFNVHLNRTLAFFLGKSDSKKGGGS